MSEKIEFKVKIMSRFSEIKEFVDHQIKSVNIQQMQHYEAQEVERALDRLRKKGDNPKVGLGGGLHIPESIEKSAAITLLVNGYSNEMLCLTVISASVFSSSYLARTEIHSPHDREFGLLANLGQSMMTVISYADNQVLDALYEIAAPLLQRGAFIPLLPNASTEGLMDGTTVGQRLFVFAFELLAARQNQTIDWDSCGIPFDRFYTDLVRKALFSEELEQYQKWLRALCDKHLDIVSRNLDEEPIFFGYEFNRLGYLR